MFEIRIIFLAAAAMAWFVQPVSATPDTGADVAAAQRVSTRNAGVIEVGTAVRQSSLVRDLLPGVTSD